MHYDIFIKYFYEQFNKFWVTFTKKNKLVDSDSVTSFNLIFLLQLLHQIWVLCIYRNVRLANNKFVWHLRGYYNTFRKKKHIFWILG